MSGKSTLVLLLALVAIGSIAPRSAAATRVCPSCKLTVGNIGASCDDGAAMVDNTVRRAPKLTEPAAPARPAAGRRSARRRSPD